MRWADFKSTRAAKGASVGQPATMLIIDTNLSLYRLTFAFIQAIEKGQGITMLLTVGKASVGLRQVSFHSYYNDSLSLSATYTNQLFPRNCMIHILVVMIQLMSIQSNFHCE